MNWRQRPRLSKSKESNGKREMIGIGIRWLILTVAITLASYLIDGIRVSGFFTALFTAVILGILNVFFRPIVLILTLPVNVMTLGLFTFVINAFMLKMASGIIPGFEVRGFWPAVFGSLIISAVNWGLSSFINEKGRVERVERPDYIDLEKRDDDTWE
jgi:putative membrane protein